MKNKKIIFFNSCRFWGGGEKWHLETAKKMKEKGYDVIICSSKNSELANAAKQSGIKVFEFNIKNLTFLNLYKIYKLKKFFEKEKGDILILNLPSDLKSAGMACKLYGKTRIVYRRGSAIVIKKTILNKIIFSKIVDYIVANSEETKKTILKNKMFEENKIYTIYNGIDVDEYNNRNYEILYKKKSDEIIVGNAGRLSYQKNQIFLIELAEFLKNKKLNFKILIAGKGELEEELKKDIKKRNLEENIILLGFVENIKSFMKSIDIFFLPSHWEGFGYVMVEAMLCEKPVIAFDTSSNPEIVENNKTGFLLEKNNLEEAYKKIKFLSENEEILKNTGIYAKKYSEKNFSLETSFEKIEELLSKIV